MSAPHDAWLSGDAGDAGNAGGGSGATGGDGEAPQNPLPAWATKGARRGGLSDEKLALFVGPRWEPTYKKKLAPFLQDPSFVPTWNWAAAFCGPLWFLYRKLYLAFAAFFIAGQLALPLLTGSNVQITATTMQDPANEWIWETLLALQASTFIAAGGTANWFLFRRARAAIRLIELQGLPEAESNRLLRRIGGVNLGGMLVMLALMLIGTVAALRA
jgi:hypothetical protein